MKKIITILLAIVLLLASLYFLGIIMYLMYSSVKGQTIQNQNEILKISGISFAILGGVGLIVLSHIETRNK